MLSPPRGESSLLHRRVGNASPFGETFLAALDPGGRWGGRIVTGALCDRRPEEKFEKGGRGGREKYSQRTQARSVKAVFSPNK